MHSPGLGSIPNTEKKKGKKRKEKEKKRKKEKPASHTRVIGVGSHTSHKGEVIDHSPGIIMCVSKPKGL